MPMSADEIKQLHDHYCKLTGLPVRYTLYHEYCWSTWELAGFSKDDLELVIHYIQRRIRDGRRERESLMFRNLIAHPESFADDLAMARVRQAPPIDRAKSEVLRATCRSDSPHLPAARSAEQILKDEAAFNSFVALKEAL